MTINDLSLQLLVTAIVQVQKHYGVKTSAVTFIFWLFILMAETLQLYSYITGNVSNSGSYTSVHLVLNLSNKLVKSYKLRDLPSML